MYTWPRGHVGFTSKLVFKLDYGGEEAREKLKREGEPIYGTVIRIFPGESGWKKPADEK